MARPEALGEAPVLPWLRLLWDPGYAARVYLVVGFLLAMVAAVVARLATDGDYANPLVNMVNQVFLGSVSIMAAVTLGRAVPLAVALGSNAGAYVVVFPLLLAVTRTEQTIRSALEYQTDLAVVAFAWAAGAILLMTAKRGLLHWVDRTDRAPANP